MKQLSFGLFGKAIIVAFWMIVILFFLYAGKIIQYVTVSKNINVLVWGQILDKEFLTDFENETGIHVNMSYFENNEELLAKIQSNSHDYDLVMPSDWAVELMIQKGLIKKLDRTKIHVWDTIYPALQHHYFDPHNDYSIPFYWSLFGPGVDVRYWKGEPVPATWALIFDERIIPERIGIVEDIRNLISVAALYLFGRYDQLTADEIEQIKRLLLQQKKHVEIYTDSRAEYVLASGVVPVSVSWFGDFLKIMRWFDYIEFVVPKEGAFVVIDSFALTATTKKDDLIYPFINYLLSKNVVQKYVDKFDFFPAVQVEVEYDERFASLVHPTKELFAHINFFKNVVSQDVLNEVLIALKA